MRKVMMSRDEMVKLALQSLGDASAENLAAFIEQKFGVRINPRYIPIFKASLIGKAHLERSRPVVQSPQGEQSASIPAA